jgi:hypothetical protein
MSPAIAKNLTRSLMTLPGAVVLAHSLRDNGTKAKLVALFTPETLKDSTIKEIRVITFAVWF